MNNPNFFTNKPGNTLIEQFKGFLNNPNNTAIKNFDAVIGFLRASGYFTLQPLLQRLSKIRILIGIDVDKYIVEAQRRGQKFMGAEVEGKSDNLKKLQHDIENSPYKEDVEEGIRLMVENLKSGQLELRAHPSKMIHAKIYIMYPDNYDNLSTGLMITGSSNLSGNGLGLSEDKQYEFNALFTRYDDVNCAREEFEKLWAEAVNCPITPNDVEEIIKKTYLGGDATPYELYIKMLIEYFGNRLSDTPLGNAYDMPEGYTRYQYQVDAVEEGYQKLLKYNGFFLADVVGLGKTIVATMIAKRFILENGADKTNILVVYPPAVEANWKKTFRDFGIDRFAKFISNSSLHKILDGSIDYYEAEEYDLVIVDEAHKFRSSTTNSFADLQQICKMPRLKKGKIGGYKKKVMLLTATPMNNSPEDIYNQILLFQDSRHCTIEGATNLVSYFSPLIKNFKIFKSKDDYDLQEFKRMAEDVRGRIIKPITVRRTRTDIENVPRYASEINAFPKVEQPIKATYSLPDNLSSMFEETMEIVAVKLKYARYGAIAYLLPEKATDLFKNPERASKSLAGIRKNGLVKRLESSFTAFKKSLDRFATANRNMIDMYNQGTVYITPDIDINALLEQNLTEEEIEEKINEKAEINPKNAKFKPEDFDKKFIDDLLFDQELLDQMNAKWQSVSDQDDKKFDTFADLLQHELFKKDINPGQKLVIFSESIDTVQYLKERIARSIDRKDILVITSKNRKDLFQTIGENFDANYKVQKNDYNIILTTDVLAEGVNLHRANIIVNYDTPWNSTRLMQRIGRVNRIGSKTKHIYNYVFYPSRQGNKEISLVQISLAKIQTFLTTFGEDNKIYSEDEILERNLESLFDAAIHPKDEQANEELPYYEELRALKSENPQLYDHISRLPLRARCARVTRKVEGVILKDDTLVFLKTNFRKSFFLVSSTVRELTAVDAFKYFKATPDEKGTTRDVKHHQKVQDAISTFRSKMNSEMEKWDNKQTETVRGAQILTSLATVDEVKNKIENIQDQTKVTHLRKLVEFGTIKSIPRELERLHRELLKGTKKLPDAIRLITDLANRYDPYYTAEMEIEQEKETNEIIVLSESFK